MLYFSDSVLNTEPSTRRISRRITLSRVVLFPMNAMRLTKYCFPSCSLIVTSTVGLSTFVALEPFVPSPFVFPLDAAAAAAGAGGGVLPSVADGRPSFFGFRSG